MSLQLHVLCTSSGRGVTSAGLEGFLDLADPIPPTRETQGVRPILMIDNEPAKESEDDMSSLAVGFIALMHKRAASTQGETTPALKY